MPVTRIGARGVLARFAAALVLVYATFNPEGYSYAHWALLPLVDTPGSFLGTLGPLKVLAGIVLVIGWVVFLQATRRSLGLKGVLLVAAVFASLVWLLVEWKLFTPSSPRAVSHIVLVVVSAILAAGMSWSLVSGKLTGQIDTDEVA